MTIFQFGFLCSLIGFGVMMIMNPSTDPYKWDARDSGLYLVVVGLISMLLSFVVLVWRYMP